MWSRAPPCCPPPPLIQDGSLLLTASDDNTAKIFDVATGSVVRELRGHADSGVYSCSFCPCGRKAVTVGGDRDAVVWEVADGSELLRVADAGGGALPLSCDWSPRGLSVITPRGASSVAEWSPLTGTLVRTFEAGGFVMSCAYSRDGLQIAATVRGGSSHVRVWSAPSGALLHQFGAGCGAGVHHPLAFSFDGRFLVTVANVEPASLRLWNLETGTLHRDLGCCGHTKAVSGCALSPDGTALLTVSRDGTARLIVAGLARVSHARMPPHAASFCNAHPVSLSSPLCFGACGNSPTNATMIFLSF